MKLTNEEKKILLSLPKEERREMLKESPEDLREILKHPVFDPKLSSNMRRLFRAHLKGGREGLAAEYNRLFPEKPPKPSS